MTKTKKVFLVLGILFAAGALNAITKENDDNYYNNLSRAQSQPVLVPPAPAAENRPCEKITDQYAWSTCILLHKELEEEKAIRAGEGFRGPRGFISNKPLKAF